MDSTPSPAAATPPATGDGCFPINKRQFKLRKHSPAIHLARQRYVIQSAERQRRMRDRDAAMTSEAHRLQAHEPSGDAASRSSGSLNKTMWMQDVEQTVQVPDAMRHTFRFANLKTIVFFLLRSWEGGCICSLAYLLKETPLLEQFGIHGCAQFKEPPSQKKELEEPSELNMTWPEDLTFARLNGIRIKGFSGEPELMELLYFLLRRAPALESLELETGALEPFFVREDDDRLKDGERCRYAMEMASTHLAPKVPSTVAFSII